MHWELSFSSKRIKEMIQRRSFWNKLESLQLRRKSHFNKDIKYLIPRKQMKLRLHRASTLLLFKNLDILWLKVQNKASKSCQNFKHMYLKRRHQIQNWERSALKMIYLKLDSVKIQKLHIRNKHSLNSSKLNSWNMMHSRIMARNYTLSSYSVVL